MRAASMKLDSELRSKIEHLEKDLKVYESDLRNAQFNLATACQLGNLVEQALHKEIAEKKEVQAKLDTLHTALTLNLQQNCLLRR